MILNQPVFSLSTYVCMLNGEATNTNFIVFGSTQSGREPVIYHTQGQHTNHCTTDAIACSGGNVKFFAFLFLIQF
jgi:hypothetical protein